MMRVEVKIVYIWNPSLRKQLNVHATGTTEWRTKVKMALWIENVLPPPYFAQRLSDAKLLASMRMPTIVMPSPCGLLQPKYSPISNTKGHGIQPRGKMHRLLRQSKRRRSQLLTTTMMMWICLVMRQ